MEKEFKVEEEQIPKDLRIVMYRIVQEALTNIAKYSGADQVRVSLSVEHGYIGLIVQDNGKGFEVGRVISDVDGRKGLGLTSMRERAELAGGHYSIESAPGEGTKVRALWPAAVLQGDQSFMKI